MLKKEEDEEEEEKFNVVTCKENGTEETKSIKTWNATKASNNTTMFGCFFPPKGSRPATPIFLEQAEGSLRASRGYAHYNAAGFVSMGT